MNVNQPEFAGVIAPDPIVDSPIIKSLNFETDDTQLVNNMTMITGAFYNPFPVEVLINESVDLMQSCITQRNILRNLEISILTSNINQSLADAKIENQNRNKLAEDNFLSSNQVLIKQIKISTINDNMVADPNSATEVKKYEFDLNDAKRIYQNACNNLQAIASAYSAQPNTATNYILRYREAKELFITDFEELYMKLKSLEVGLKGVYNIDMPMPEPISNPLNGLYKYLKQAIFSLGRLLDRDEECTLILPLKTGYENINGVTWNLADFDAQLATGTISFKLPSSIFPLKECARLRGIGVCMRIDARATENELWNITISPPLQKILQVVPINPPTLSLGCLNARELTYDNQAKSLTFLNADPFANNNWVIKLPEKSSFGNPRSDIQDIYLYLRIAVIDPI
jgi:hypothetical protein